MLNKIKENAASLGLFAFFALMLAALISFSSFDSEGRKTFGGDIAESTICEGLKQLNDNVVALSGADVPQDATSGCEPSDLPQMGSLTYYKVDVSSPAAFVNAVNGRGFNEGYGFQCVAGFKEFMYSLGGKYVAAAGGGAKGYASQQAQIEPLGFKWHGGTSGLQNGDWGIWTNGAYGHVAMYYNGQWFGQNQYAANPNTGNAFNLANISTNGLAGYYRPNIYQNQTPAPIPQPEAGGNTGSTGGANNPASAYTVKRGDTLGGISLGLGWWPSTNGLYGDAGYTQRLAELNGLQNRGVIYPNQVIKRAE